MKRLLALFLAISIILSSFPIVNHVSATSEIDKLQKKLDLLDKEKNELNKRYKENLKNQTKLEKDISYLEDSIESIRSSIKEVEGQIEVATDELLDIEEQLVITIREVDEQDNALRKRLRIMYKFRKHGFLEVLSQSKDLADLLTRMDRIQLILESDKEMLLNLEKSKELVEKTKAQMQEKKHNLEVYRAELQRKNADLNANLEVVAKKKRELAMDADLALKNINKLNEDSERLTKLIASLEISSEFVGGPFAWPLDRKYRNITSEFGYRIHPVYKVPLGHSGTDIGAPTGANIYAAQSGVVLLSGVNGGYGNCVIIDHGGGMMSVYGHASILKCKKGQTVKKGDLIALVGNTGVSTGPHLHFEIRVKGSPVDAMQYFKK